jgi:hypothetical protein
MIGSDEVLIQHFDNNSILWVLYIIVLPRFVRTFYCRLDNFYLIMAKKCWISYKYYLIFGIFYNHSNLKIDQRVVSKIGEANQRVEWNPLYRIHNTYYTRGSIQGELTQIMRCFEIGHVIMDESRKVLYQLRWHRWIETQNTNFLTKNG